MLTIDEILQEKTKANELLSTNHIDAAEEAYRAIIDKINKSPEDTQKDEKIQEQKKFILSNLAHVLTKKNKIKEAKKCDIEIIKKLDKTFSKSYARLVKAYLGENNFTLARYHYDLMQKNVSQDIMNKFPEIESTMQKEVEKHDQMAQNLVAMRSLLSQK